MTSRGHWRRLPLYALLLIFLNCAMITRNSGAVEAAAAAGGAGTTNEAPPTMGVITLNSNNFDSSLRDGNIWLIEFYAPW